MAKMEKYLVKYFWLVTILICLPAVWALFVPGYFGASDDLHVAWLFEMDRLVKLGQFPPRFVPDLSYQFGYPLFNFVFPLPFYLGELFHLLGLNFVDSVKAVFLISVPLSFILMYKLLKEFSSPLISLAGATLYIYTPYRANDLYNRGAIGEILGFVFLPLITWCVVKLNKEKTLFNKWVGIGGLGIAALILTHDIMAYMFLPVLAILALIYLLFYKKNILFWNLVLIGSLGLFISLYFWLPAILDSSLMKYDTVFNFQDHFPTLMQLVKPYWGYGASVPGPGDGMSFFIGLVNWLVFLVGVPLFFYFRQKINSPEKIFLLWGYGIFLLAIVMMNYRSTFFWQHLPELPYFQFPWRFLTLTTFASAIFLLILDRCKYAKQIGLGLVIVIIALNAFQFQPHDFLGRMDSYYLNRYVPYPVASRDYEQTQEEYLRLPKQTQYRPNKIYPLFWTNDGTVLSGISNGLDGQIQINFSSPQMLNFNKYNFPGWVATIDNQPARINFGYPFGQVAIGVPAGPHLVQVKFQETSFKLFLDLVSLLSLLIALKLILPTSWSRKNV